jgi:selenocysteine lyase/cysteine desulfurase
MSYMAVQDDMQKLAEQINRNAEAWAAELTESFKPLREAAARMAGKPWTGCSNQQD